MTPRAGSLEKAARAAMAAGTPPSEALARRLDAEDPLAPMRERFALPENQIYLDGNSLGALPRVTQERLRRLIAEEWGRDLIKSWNDHAWIDYPHRIGEKIARLIGAKSGEVIAADSTSINLFKCIVAALKLKPAKRVILTESGNFPTDLYIIQGLQRMLDDAFEVRLAEPSAIVGSIVDDVGVVVLTHVHYKTALMHDMEEITRRAHEMDALVVWDLSHSAGAVEVDLNEAGADFAVGCGYKYLNGGPGAPAYMFVAERHHAAAMSPLTGWLGHARPFDFVDDYEPAGGIARFLCGAPPILGMAALDAGVDLMLEAGMARIARKSRALCRFFIDAVEERCAGFGLELIGPQDLDRRGSHVSLAHPDGYPIMQNLIASGVVGDFRAPDAMRFGFTPLYIGFEDVWRAVEILAAVLRSESWRQPKFHQRRSVT